MRSDPNARWLEELGATPRRVALIYAALAAAWILLSDRIVDALVSDSGLISAIQTIKISSLYRWVRWLNWATRPARTRP